VWIRGGRAEVETLEQFASCWEELEYLRRGNARLNKERGDRSSLEEAFAEAGASVRLEGLNPSGPEYDAIKARVIADVIAFDQAATELTKSRPKFHRSSAGFPSFPDNGCRIITKMVRKAEEKIDIEDARMGLIAP
jgi:hypothetical protein